MEGEIMKNVQVMPKRGILEEIGNAVTHGVGSVFSIVVLILMLINSKTSVETISAIIYFIGMFMMFTMSCLYHAFKTDSKVKRLFRRFDYLSIYLLIGSTYAPILLSFVGGVEGIVICAIQWVIIVTGVTIIGVFGPNRPKWLHFTLYFILGWCGIILVPILIKDLTFFLLILAGGIVYTIGIIPFVLKKKVAHFIWHFFVLFGAVIQWIGIFITIYL
jgi:hemolysin III